MYGLGSRGGTPGGRLGGAFPEEMAEVRKEEGMAEEAAVEMADWDTMVGGPMEAAWRPMARLLTGPSAEEDTVLTEEAPRDAWAAVAAREEGTATEGAMVEAKEEESKLEEEEESPSTLWCCSRLGLDVRTEEAARLFCCATIEWLCWDMGMVLGGRSSLCPSALRDV